MAEACANKNSKEWKTLVSQTGEELANLAFVANNYQIPDVKSVTEIKKEIGFKSKVDNFAGIAAKLRKFNRLNGTSHYFTFKRAWGNTFELNLKYNYLPVNLEKQRQREAAKGDPLYVVNDFDSTGFNQMYPSSRTDEMLSPQTADVILPIGTSGSGKSTFIKSLPQKNLVVIEPDAMRVEFTGNINDKSKDKEIYNEAANRAIQAIKQGKQVVFDTTNLTKDKRRPFIEAIKKAIPTANIQYKLMELNPELAKQRIKAQIARGENRANVSDETIDRHAESYKQMLEDIKNEPISNFEASNRTDELIDSAEMQVADVEKKRQNKINTEIIKERQLLKTVEDPDEYRKIISRIEKLKKAVDEAEGRVIRAKNIESFDEVLDYADLQLKEIQALIANPAITADDVYYAQRILDLWMAAGDFSTEPHEHIILDEDEFNTDAIREAFSAVRANAMDLQSRLTKIRKDHVTNFVRQYTDGKLTQAEIFQALKDVNKLGTMTLNLSRHDDAMLQAIFAAVERANIEAQQEASEMWETLDKLTKKFLKKSGGNFDILKQVTEDGKETGRAVSRFSSEFYETRNEMMKAAFWARDPKTGKLKKDKAKINAYFDWTNKNTISFDPRALFPDENLPDGDIPAEFIYKRVTFSEKAREEHIAELKSQLGEKGYDFYIKRVEAKIEKFKIRREAIYQSMQSEPGLSKNEKDALFEAWQKEHSPYWGMDMAANPATRVKGKDSSGKDTYFAPKGIREYVEQVPRKTINGAETKWYDKNFARIEADEDLLAYHEYMMNTLNTLRYTLPQQKQALLGVGVLPTIQKSLMDTFQEKGMMMGIIPFWDKMKELQTTTDLATNVYSDINPLTGDIEKNIQVQFVEDTEAKVRDLVKQKTLKYQQDTGKPATNADRVRFRKEARDYLSKQKSWDVTKILKAYSLTTLGYKHKSIIEPQIRLAEQEFNRRKEVVTNKAGQPQYKNGKIVTEEGLDNLKSALEFFMDSTFYGVGGRKVEGISKTKLYTKAEETRKKELEELLENETDPATKDWIQSQINGLGGFRTASGVGDTVLKYMTLKGLGWNLFSAGSNIGFGIISNMIQASDGREYSMANLQKAHMLVLNSIGRNLSFNTWEGVNSNAVKIRTLMDKWDLLQTSNKEMFDMSQKSSMSKLKRFGPFSLQERSEYLNYAPVMVAIMMSDKFSATDPDGNKVTLWDAYDVKSGKLKEGFTSDVDEVRLVQKIKRVIEMNHGDYNNALQVKATFAGRALSQFRTWMFEGFANRFESEKVDYALSYGLDEPYLRKGRYRSYTKGQMLTTGAAVGSMFLPGVGTALGAGIGYLGGKFFGMQTEENVMSDTLFTLKQLARKLMFQKTQFADKFNETDAANMRKNMTELYIMMTLMGIALFLKAMAGDDDEEDQMVTNFLLNQTIRLRTDIGFYTNPLEFEKLTKTAVPMAQLVQDVASLVADTGNLFDEDVKNDVYRSGSFKKQPKWLVHLGKIVPGPAQAIRLYKTGDKVMD
jgi:predicted kinase